MRQMEIRKTLPEGSKNKYIHQNNIIEKEKSQYAGKDTLEENDES